jgi:outer membrane protein insertion porin family
MRKGGLGKALAGLSLGVLLGLGVLALKSYLADQAILLLEEEVTASCDCTLMHDGVRVSLLPLVVEAKRPRIVSQGKTALEFEKVRADFSLSDIRNRRILMTDLLLANGTAYGVGPDSPTFQFIDHLTQPIAPEKDRPGRWRLVMESLQVAHSRMIEPFTHSSLTGEGVSLEVRRDEKDNFILIPQIDKLRVVENPAQGPSQSAIVELGKLRSYLYIDGTTVTYDGLRLALKNSLLSGKALSKTKEDNLLSGPLSYQLRSQDYSVIPDWFRSIFSGNAQFSGSLGRPIIRGNLGLAPNTTLDLFGTPEKPIARLDSLNGEIGVEIRRGAYQVFLPALEASGNGYAIKTIQPIRSDSGSLSGKLELGADQLVFEDGTFHDVHAELTLSHLDTEPEATITGTSALVVTKALEFAEVRFKINVLNDSVKLEFSHRSPDKGELIAKGQILLSDEGPELKQLDYTANQFALFQGASIPNWYFGTLRFNSRGSLSGPVDLSKLEGSAEWDARSTESSLPIIAQGKANLKNGNLHLPFTDSSNISDVTLDLGLVSNLRSKLSVRTSEMRFEDFYPELSCVKAAGNLEYDFALEAPLAGNGKLGLKKFSFGCGQYQVQMEQDAPIPIAAGKLNLPPLSFIGNNTAMLLQGNLGLAGEMQLNAQGKLQLSSLVALAPSLDDIQGKLSASLDIRGSLAAPLLKGKAKVEDAEFSIESAGLSCSDIDGELTLENSLVRVQEMRGVLNGGQISARGELYPFDLSRSALKIDASGVAIEPLDRTLVQLGGSLSLQALPSGKAGITGTIEIESGEVTRALDVPSLLRDLSNSVFSSASQQQFSASLPELELDLAVKANRNFFLYTNWAGAELKGQLHVSGSLPNPVLNGEISTIAGWFGIRDRRFEISSGSLLVKSTQGQPILDLIGETYVPARTGETVLVIAEANGPLLSPRISLSSDSGLSQREILNLLASGGNLGGQTRVNTISQNYEMNQEVLFTDFNSMTLASFLSDLTSLNSLSLQPTYNLQTGLIEPFVVAEKRITDGFSIIGESSLGGTVTESRLKALFDLTPALKLAAIAESVSSRQKTAFGADVTYTILAKQFQSLNISVRGNKQLETNWILRRLRLNESSRIPIGDMERVKRALLDIYRNEGYRTAKAEVSCNGPFKVCEVLDIQIEEGPIYIVTESQLTGDPLSSAFNTQKFLSSLRGSLATEALRAKAESELTRALRSEGFLEARVKAEYLALANSNVQLNVDVRTGRPVSFSFNGNSHFSPREFLDTINLFERKLPFGNNTVNILLQNMERLYRQAGFLYATLSSERLEEPGTNRITYQISVDEGPKVTVEAVEFSGLTGITPEEIQKQLNQEDLNASERLFKPRFAIAEEIDANIALLIDLLKEQGYIAPSIQYKIEASDNSDRIKIHYLVSQGPDARADWFVIEGAPQDIEIPAAPEAPYSIRKANRYIELILQVLRERGYLDAALWSDLNADEKRLTVHIEPGQQTHIGNIKIEGNLNTQVSTIRNALRFKEQEVWDSKVIASSKTQLFKLGLFSRIEIEPADGVLDQAIEDMQIRVTEKALRTLELGTGLNSEYGLHLFGEATDRALFGDGRSLSLRLDTYYDSATTEISQGVAGLRYFVPSLFASNFSLAEDLRFQKVDLSTQEFDLDRISLASYLYNSSFERLSFSMGHTVLYEDLSNVSPGAIIGEEDSGNVRLSFVSGTLNYDERDNPLNPRRGFNLNFDYKLASELIGSDADYYGLGAKASFIVPGDLLLLPRFSFALSSRLASTWTFGRSSQVPITQRFYLGGRNTIRGFRENSLGPRGADGSVIGGDLLIAQSAELRYLILDSLSIHTFFDAGSVYLQEESASVDDLRYSSGVGFRFLSPIGPIGMDLGAPLNQRDGEPSLRLHFSIGSNF